MKEYSMDKEELEKYRKAGRIFQGIKADVLGMLKPGIKLIDVAEFIEGRIEKAGAKTAFPPNLSLNNIAAHATPAFGDVTEIKEGDLLKIDIGIHVDGYIADAAFSYCSQKNELVDCSNTLLEEVVKHIKSGISVSEIGSVIEGTVNKKGLGVVVNLTGHSLERNIFHGPVSIPNTKNNIDYVFEEGDVIALEPFIVKSNTQVKESAPCEIYMHVMDRPVRMPEARKILEIIRDQYGPFPFCKRWLCREISPVKVSLALMQLESAGAVQSFPPLKDMTGQKIAQCEETIIFSEKPIVTTRG